MMYPVPYHEPVKCIVRVYVIRVSTRSTVSTYHTRRFRAFFDYANRVPGGYSRNVWVGRCGWGAETLNLFKTEVFDFPTLFKTEISDFPTLFRTACSFLRPGPNTSNQKSLSSFVVA